MPNEPVTNPPNETEPAAELETDDLADLPPLVDEEPIQHILHQLLYQFHTSLTMGTGL